MSRPPSLVRRALVRRALVRRALVALLLAATTLTGCGSPDAGESTVQLGGSEAVGRTVERPWGTVAAFPELERAETPVEADLVFAREMAPHHEQAIELSDGVLRHPDVDERVAATARYIRDDQELEVGVMEEWLEAWREEAGGGSAPAVGTTQMAGMPGMVPPRQVRALGAMSPGDAEVEFLVLMVEHHRGAVQMAQDYLGEAVNTFTLSIARHIIREQQVEVDYLLDVLDDLCAAGGVTTCP